MHRRDAAQHKFDHGNRRFPISLISLGLAGSGTNKFSTLTLKGVIRNPLRYLLISSRRFQRQLSMDFIHAEHIILHE